MNSGKELVKEFKVIYTPRDNTTQELFLIS